MFFLLIMNFTIVGSICHLIELSSDTKDPESQSTNCGGGSSWGAFGCPCFPYVSPHLTWPNVLTSMLLLYLLGQVCNSTFRSYLSINWLFLSFCRVSFEFQHNVCGRSTYAEGTVDAVIFLSKKVLILSFIAYI